MLNPEPSIRDILKQLDDLKIGLQTISEDNATVRTVIEESMKNEIGKLVEKIANPPLELRSDFEKIKSELYIMMQDVQQHHDCIAKEVSGIKDITNKTFHLVADIRYKVTNSNNYFNFQLCLSIHVFVCGSVLSKS